MESILAFMHLDDPASRKRAAFALAGGLVTLFANPVLAKLGMEKVGPAEIAAFAGIVATFIAQSGAKSIAEAKQAGELAAQAIKTSGDATKVFSDPLPPAAPEASAAPSTGVGPQP